MDDARLVEAPADAHVVWLVPTITKIVQVAANAVRLFTRLRRLWVFDYERGRWYVAP
jgi:hypothetical protein